MLCFCNGGGVQECDSCRKGVSGSVLGIILLFFLSLPNFPSFPFSARHGYPNYVQGKKETSVKGGCWRGVFMFLCSEFMLALDFSGSIKSLTGVESETLLQTILCVYFREQSIPPRDLK